MPCTRMPRLDPSNLERDDVEGRGMADVANESLATMSLATGPLEGRSIDLSPTQGSSMSMCRRMKLQCWHMFKDAPGGILWFTLLQSAKQSSKNRNP